MCYSAILQFNRVDTIFMLIASGDRTDSLFRTIQQTIATSPKPKKCTNSIDVILSFNQFEHFVKTLDLNGFKISYCMESAENFTLRHACRNKIPKHFRESSEFIYEKVRRLIR